MAFVDLQKAFDCVPLKVIWWALRKLGVLEFPGRTYMQMILSSLLTLKRNVSGGS